MLRKNFRGLVAVAPDGEFYSFTGTMDRMKSRIASSTRYIGQKHTETGSTHNYGYSEIPSTPLFTIEEYNWSERFKVCATLLVIRDLT